MNEDSELIQQALASNSPELLTLAYKILAHPERYKSDPVGYCRNVLGVKLWAKQIEILQALVKYKRVLVKSGNALGKSFTAACAAEWFYATHNPGICIATAPTARQVEDILFKEIRALHKSKKDIFPRLPRIEDAPNHYLHGFTTTDSNAFQGVHCDRLFVIFEECVGVEACFWEAAESILIGGQDTYFLAICNPTDISSQAYLEEQSGRWHVISVSAYDHPNIALELEGNPPLIPGAIRLAALETLLGQWCQIVNDTPLPTDIVHKGHVYRPGPIAEARILGRYPSQGSYSIFSEQDLAAALFPRTFTRHDKYHIGCDVARFGDDFTTIHVRRGSTSILHESYNKRDTVFTAERLKTLADELATRWVDENSPLVSVEQRRHQIEQQARAIPIKIDDAGVGGGVVDQKAGYAFIGINGASKAYDEDYPNRRSELLFSTQRAMEKGLVSFTGLPRSQQDEIRRQALSIQYKLDGQGRRVAEKKDEQKKRIGRSPDDFDAVVLAYSIEGVVVDADFNLNIKKKERTINF